MPGRSAGMGDRELGAAADGKTAHRKLNALRVRGLAKVHVHAYMAILVLQAQALATGTRASVRGVS